MLQQIHEKIIKFNNVEANVHGNTWLGLLEVAVVVVLQSLDGKKTIVKDWNPTYRRQILIIDAQ